MWPRKQRFLPLMEKLILKREGSDLLTCLPLILFLMLLQPAELSHFSGSCVPRQLYTAHGVQEASPALEHQEQATALPLLTGEEDSLFALIIPKPLYLEENKIFIRYLWLWRRRLYSN